MSYCPNCRCPVNKVGRKYFCPECGSIFSFGDVIEPFQPELGDYVVHIVHGTARYVGMATLCLDGVDGRYLTLEFAKGDRLYLPVDRPERIRRYAGHDKTPVLDKMGRRAWTEIRKRPPKEVR